MTKTIEMYLDPLNIIGTSIDDYAVTDYLTTGGTAHIYIAETYGRLVVMKLLRDEMSGEPDAKRRFHKEAYALKQLEHPHIIKLLNEGRYNHDPYMVFEYAPLGSLQDYAENDHSDFTLGDVAIIIQQIASALHTLHEQNFIHRDVKPSNIMMRAKHDTALADFGIVRTEDVNMRFSVQPGTLDFMAPEQIEGLDADFTTDQFALGVLTYWLLTGEKPFKADTREEAALQRRVGAVSVYDINHKLPKEFDSILSRAMHFDMNERFTFIEEFAHLIVQIIEEHKLHKLPALGTTTTRAHITHSRDSDNYLEEIEKEPKRLTLIKAMSQPYGWITIGLLSAMLIIVAISSASSIGNANQLQALSAEQVVNDLMQITSDPDNFDCVGFVPLYNRVAEQVTLANSEFNDLIIITNNNSATKTFFMQHCVDRIGDAIAPNLDLWNAMRQELATLNPN